MKFTDQSKNVIIDKLEDLYKRKKNQKIDNQMTKKMLKNVHKIDRYRPGL